MRALPKAGSAQKFAIVVETAPLHAEELSAYGRRQGRYPPQIEAWRTACTPAHAPVGGQAERAQRRTDQVRIKQLEPEVGRQDTALAEAAALLLLPKNPPPGPRPAPVGAETRSG